jgi:EF hand domain-containing protein
MRPQFVMLLAGLALAVGVNSASAQSKAEIQRMDRNGDGVVTRAEWQGPDGAFRLHDSNKDGVLSGNEVFEPGQNRNRLDQFRDFDVNNDGVITRNEWHNSIASFRALDRNRDNRISRVEFREFRDDVAGTSGRDNRDNFRNAYSAGYERGWAEGQVAGRRRDANRNHGWDLENRAELRSGDSGYESRFGARAEYRDGYRDGFRAGYADQWWR